MSEIDGIIKRMQEFTKLNKEKELAELLGISPGDFHNRKKRGTLKYKIVDWALNENVDFLWLLKGETTDKKGLDDDGFDPPLSRTIPYEEKSKDVFSHLNGPSQRIHSGKKNLLQMTSEILSSKGEHAERLAANIRSLYNNILNEQRINELESQVRAMEVEVKRRLNGLDHQMSTDRRKGQRRTDESQFEGVEKRKGIDRRAVGDKL